MAAQYRACHEAIIKTVQLIVGANEAELMSVHLPVDIEEKKKKWIDLSVGEIRLINFVTNL